MSNFKNPKFTEKNIHKFRKVPSLTARLYNNNIW